MSQEVIGRRGRKVGRIGLREERVGRWGFGRSGGIETDMKDRGKVGVNKGRWSSYEHFKFLEGIKMFGKDWKKLNLHIKTRTSVQIRSHAQKFFSKLSKENKAFGQFQEDIDLEELKKNLLQSEMPQAQPITAESTNHVSKTVPVHQSMPKDSPQTEVPIKIPVQIDPEVNKVASIPNPPFPRRTREKEERKETDEGEKSSKVSKPSSKDLPAALMNIHTTPNSPQGGLKGPPDPFCMGMIS